MIGIGIIVPVIPALIENLSNKSLNEAAEIGGWMMAAYAVMQFIFAPILGELSDRYGRKPVLLMSMFGLGLDYLFHAFAPTLLWLFVGRIIAGITGASHTVANAYMADISTPDNKAKNFGIIGAAFGLGFIIGPAIGGVFGHIDLRLPFFIAAAVSLVNFVFGWIFVPESLSIEKRRSLNFKKMIPGVSLVNLINYKSFRYLLLALFLASVAGQSLPATWTYYTMEKFDWNEAEVGYSLSAVGLIVALVQGFLVNWSIKKFGTHLTIKIGFFFWAFGMILYAIAFEPWMIYAFLIPYSIGGIAGPTLRSLISNKVSDKEQGNLQGTITSMISITTIVGPLMASQLFYVFGDIDELYYFPGAPYIFSAIVFVLGAIFAKKGLDRLDEV